MKKFSTLKLFVFPLFVLTFVVASCDKDSDQSSVPVGMLSIDSVVHEKIASNKYVDHIYITTKMPPNISIVEPCGCPNPYEALNKLNSPKKHHYVFDSYRQNNKRYQVIVNAEFSSTIVKNIN
ncbi:hypothetical protein [Rubrolithibacter danxiaensis]|uniref:hypothetical protein n=1 Tax=Rubrolithibacter danxiaensis TaxID=3390805 RepID=UPI003BF8105B